MTDSRFWHLARFRATYVGLSLMLALIYILPATRTPLPWVAPDLVYGLTVCWLLRRPDYVPVLLIALVSMIADVLHDRPLGLMTALMVVWSEFLRPRTTHIREGGFVFEWIVAATGIAGLVIAQKVILALTFAPGNSWRLTFLYVLSTALFYPLVVWVSSSVLRINYPSLIKQKKQVAS